MSSHYAEVRVTCEFAVQLSCNMIRLTAYCRTKLSLSHALSQSVKISLVRVSSTYLSPHPGSKLLTSPGITRVSPFPSLWDVAPFLQFEELISSTIEETKDIPETISETGKIGMPHKGKCRSLTSLFIWVFSLTWPITRLPLPEIMRQIGELFLLRTDINSVGSVLDSPVSR